MASWTSMLELQSSIPFECFENTKDEYEKITVFLEKLRNVKHFSLNAAKLYFNTQTTAFLKPELLTLRRVVHTRLEKSGWITKEYAGVQPRSEKTAYIGEN